MACKFYKRDFCTNCGYYPINKNNVPENKKRNSRWKKNRKKVTPEYIDTITKLMSNFKEIKLEWIQRKLNLSAHLLSRDPFLDKYTEHRSKNINVRYIEASTYLAQSSKDENKYYTVDLELGTCTCPFFMMQKWWERKKCKHIIAAERLALVTDSTENAQ